jgi:hypothetical protein
MSFSRSLRLFHGRTLTKFNKVRALAALDIFSSIIIATPVDKGPLRNNWFVSLNTAVGTANPNDTGGGGQEKVNEITAKVEGYDDPFDDILFINNLKYAGAIEYDGHSSQAPGGMVRVNTSRWDQVVRQALRRVSYGD